MAASASAAPSVGPAQGAQAKARAAPAAAWPRRPAFGARSARACETPAKSGEPGLESVSERADHQDEAHRDHDPGRDVAQPGDCAQFHAERRECSADKGEGQRKARRQRQRAALVARAAGGDDDRRKRQDARAQDRQRARRERERQREDRIHIAAFSTLTTEFSVMPHDIRETSLPPL